MNKIYLGVNIDHVATIRNARGTSYPDPVTAATIAEMAGADSITTHLREDRRHITDRDVRLIREVISTRLNLEMAVTEEILGIAEGIAPQAACLVPERRQEITTEGGLDVVGNYDKVAAAVERLGKVGTECSLFIDPEIPQIDAAVRCGAPVIEFHTGAYANATTDEGHQRELEKLRDMSAYAASRGLKVNSGHGLNYQNVCEVAAIPQMHELNIGHSIIARAIFSGLAGAVTEMKQLITTAHYLPMH